MTTSAVGLVDEANFIRSTRDAGYASTQSALAELVDNAIEAGASRIDIRFHRPEGGDEPFVSLQDNGVGMDQSLLGRALQFGGTCRFDHRSGLGRFGIGLPNSSLSQARRVDVYSWQAPSHVLRVSLDVDLIVARRHEGFSPPESTELPCWIPRPLSQSGTLVVWSRCDRLQNRRISTLCRKTERALGRIFRRYISNGLALYVNDRPVVAFDPLFLNGVLGDSKAEVFASPLLYRVRSKSAASDLGTISVRFAVLPVSEWSHFSAAEKRRLGIAGGGGTSVLRADREVAHGWYFMGEKRRENYDDWWRCEVSFDPILDEYFGVTNNKQGIRPTPELESFLSPDIESIARQLNRGVRDAFTALNRVDSAPAVASRAERYLPTRHGQHRSTHPHDLHVIDGDIVHAQYSASVTSYRIVSAQRAHGDFYSVRQDESQITIELNQHHPFYTHVYLALSESNDSSRAWLDLLLLSLARGECAMEDGDPARNSWLQQRRRTWSDALAVFLEEALT